MALGGRVGPWVLSEGFLVGFLEAFGFLGIFGFTGALPCGRAGFFL
jgi:hypothetical protein